MREPDFWQDPGSLLGRFLSPLGWLYAEATARRLARAEPWRAPVPVICVGNLTAGGAGKTPVVRDLAARLIQSGRRPHVLSRGHGGRQTGPLKVDPETHTAADVGDEPLLLARDAPCWVSADRAQGAQAIIGDGGNVIIMDDGLQNPSLHQDMRLVVVDGEVGFGNGRCLPAGPLRERIDAGLARADAVVLIGDDKSRLAARLSGRTPVLHARLTLLEGEWLAGTRLVAFAGIGRPEKFRATLAESSGEIALFRGFADHHPYSNAELAALAGEADRLDAVLATTEKDWVRLTPSWRAKVRAVPVRLQWREDDRVTTMLKGLFADG